MERRAKVLAAMREAQLAEAERALAEGRAAAQRKADAMAQAAVEEAKAEAQSQAKAAAEEAANLEYEKQCKAADEQRKAAAAKEAADRIEEILEMRDRLEAQLLLDRVSDAVSVGCVWAAPAVVAIKP